MKAIIAATMLILSMGAQAQSQMTCPDGMSCPVIQLAECWEWYNIGRGYRRIEVPC